MNTAVTKQKVSAGEPKSRKRPQKQLVIVKAVFELIINRSNKNASTKNKEFEISQSEMAISMTKVNNNLHKPKSFYEDVNNLIYDWH